MRNDNRIVVTLTRLQASFLERLLEGTEGSTEDFSVSLDCKRIRRKLDAAFVKSDAPEKEAK